MMGTLLTFLLGIVILFVVMVVGFLLDDLIEGAMIMVAVIVIYPPLMVAHWLSTQGSRFKAWVKQKRRGAQ